MLLRKWVLALLLATTILTATGRAAGFDDLLKLIPDAANAIVLIDVDAVHNSPLAVRERWKDNYEQAYIDRPLILPPEADRLVLAARLDPERELASDIELAVMDLSEPMSLRSIARAEGGYVDQIDSVSVVWTPSDAYFIEVDEKLLAVAHPADRQQVARWARFAGRNDEIVISPYLQNAAEAVNKDTQIVMALDARNMIQPHRLREELEIDRPKVLEGKDVDLDELTDVLTSLVGVTLKVSIGEKPMGSIRVDFDKEIGLIAPFAKPLLLEAMADLGATIEDLEAWKSTVEYKSIFLEGELSRDAMRRIFSILELPTTKFSTLDESADSEAAGQEEVAQASKRYFNSITVLIHDLGKTLNKGAANAAAWMSRYARKIDRLPILHVDEDLLAYGAGVAQAFRQMSDAKTAAGIRTGVRRSNTYSGYRYSGYRGGTIYRYGTSGYSRDTSRIRSQELAKARTVRMNLWTEIENATADIRRTMTQRYQVEF